MVRHEEMVKHKSIISGLLSSAKNRKKKKTKITNQRDAHFCPAPDRTQEKTTETAGREPDRRDCINQITRSSSTRNIKTRNKKIKAKNNPKSHAETTSKNGNISRI